MSCAKSRNSVIKIVWWCNIVYQTGYFLKFHRKTYIMLDKRTLIVSYLASSSTLSNWSLWANIMEELCFWFVRLYQITSLLKALYLTAEKKVCSWSDIDSFNAQKVIAKPMHHGLHKNNLMGHRTTCLTSNAFNGKHLIEQ